ncbi:MAG: YciI family protein [Acidobacteriota bacterium]
MKQFLYVLKPTRPAMLKEGPTATEAASGERHVAYLRDLVDKGQVLLFGRTQENDDSTFGLVVFEADGEAAARAIMEGDPAVAEGLMTARLQPYRIAGGRLTR